VGRRRRGGGRGERLRLDDPPLRPRARDRERDRRTRPRGERAADVDLVGVHLGRSVDVGGNEPPEIPTVGGSAHRPAQPQLTGLPTRLLVLVIRVTLPSTVK
jgi:hypothetical protein